MGVKELHTLARSTTTAEHRRAKQEQEQDNATKMSLAQRGKHLFLLLFQQQQILPNNSKLVLYSLSAQEFIQTKSQRKTVSNFLL